MTLGKGGSISSSVKWEWQSLHGIQRSGHSADHRAIISYYLAIIGFPDSSVDKESACNAGDLGLIPGEDPMENSMDYIVHGVAKSRTQLSDLHFHFIIYQD